MEQMYLIEIFIDKVTIFVSDSEEPSGATKSLIIKINFGPKVQFIIKEGQLAPNEQNKDDIIECDENGRRKWSRTIRVGKSYLFPSYPDTVLMILSKFPLEIEIWNDDKDEKEIFVGIGNMHWDTAFFHMLKDTAEACKIHEPLSIKQLTPIFAECCCRQCGEVAFILRLCALGDSIVTEFQQLMKDPDAFVFRTNKAPSMFQCKRIEGDDPNFCMVGSLYEATTLEDPDVVSAAQKKIEICTELQSCGVAQSEKDYKCDHVDDEEQPKKTYPIDKIRMGDITGPCGNANCALAHKVRDYIRNLEAYKKQSSGIKKENVNKTKKICGSCDCRDDKWHRADCPENLDKTKDKNKVPCSGCGGMVPLGTTCEDNKNKFYGTGASPKVSAIKTLHSTGATPRDSPTKSRSKTTIQYLYSITNIANHKAPLFKKSYAVEKFSSNLTVGSCHCKPSLTTQVLNINSLPTITMPSKSISSSPMLKSNIINIYNVETKDSAVKKSPNCLILPDGTEYKCSPKKPSPPCKTFDCDCITKSINHATRKRHQPYCPSFKHKNNCPVTMTAEDSDKKPDEEEDETEPLPYGLPPIKLGPCPVMGKPCTYPDGFARLYKAAAQPPLPVSYTDAGKVCCSKEYERLKDAIKDYMKYEKDHDYRCINKFNVDTERRCCDKEQKLLSLIGKSCCGSHKMAIQEKYQQGKQ